MKSYIKKSYIMKSFGMKSFGMKSYLSLTWKELKAQKVTAVLILTAVILSGTMTTALGQSLSILQTLRTEQAASLNGNRYASFHQLTEEQALQLKKDDRLYDVGSLITVGYTELGNSGLTLFAREYLDNALEAYPSINRLAEGRLPAAPREIALPGNALQYLDRKIRVGDTITLQLEINHMSGTTPAYQYSADFTVCGILESNYLGYSTGTLDAVLGEGSAAALLPEAYLLYSTHFKTRDTLSFQDTVDDLAELLGLDKAYVQYNWILLDALGISYEEAGDSDTDTGFSFMTLACVMVGALVLLAAGLVIYNILKIAVARRIREYGTLRAIGGGRSQLYRLVSLQLLILCGMGIPVGLLAGALSAKGILIAATGMLSPDLFIAGSTQELNTAITATDSHSFLPFAVSAAITLSFAMLAAFPAARYASHVAPTVAMSGQSIKIKRRMRKAKRIRNFEAYYARLNLKRGRGRTVITILSLVMSITVFIALQSFTAILDASSSLKDMNPGDYAVTDEILGIDPQSVAELRESQWVNTLSTTKLSTCSQDEQGSLPVELSFSLQPWEAFHIAGLDDARLTALAGELSQQDVQDLLSGAACIVKNPIPFSYEGQTVETTDLKPGDMVSVNGCEMRIAGLAAAPVTINNVSFLNGVQIIVNDGTYDLLTGKNRYSEVYPTLAPGADSGKFEEWLDSWCGKNPGSHWLSYQQENQQLAESFEQIHMLCWGLILFIGLIGILNIINTVYSSLHTRISEIGMQRAIGMSAGSLYRTFLWEGACYGMIASVTGGVLGYFCAVFVNAASADTLELVAIPFVPILEAAMLSIAACLLATAVPLRAVARMNIVEAIEAID